MCVALPMITRLNKSNNTVTPIRVQSRLRNSLRLSIARDVSFLFDLPFRHAACLETVY